MASDATKQTISQSLNELKAEIADRTKAIITGVKIPELESALLISPTDQVIVETNSGTKRVSLKSVGDIFGQGGGTTNIQEVVDARNDGVTNYPQLKDRLDAMDGKTQANVQEIEDNKQNIQDNTQQIATNKQEIGDLTNKYDLLNQEVVDAREDNKTPSVTHNSLKERLDSDFDYLNSQVSDIVDRKLKYIEKQQTYISRFHNKLVKNEGVSIGFYGDSMTYGYDTQSADKRPHSVTDNAGGVYTQTRASKTFPEAFKEIMDDVYGVGKVKIVERGIGGDYVSKALTRWLPKTHPIGTDIAVMNYGINDSRLASCPYAGNTDEFLKYYRQLIEAELDNGTGIILMTPFKVRTTDVRIQAFETAVINLAKEYEIPVIIGDEMASNMSYKWYSDATHWNGQGYKYVGTRIASCFIGDGILNPTRVSENTQLLTRRQLDGIWWDATNKEIYHSSPATYPTPDEAVDKGGLAIRIGVNSTVYYSFYAEKDVWIVPFLGFNENNSRAVVRLNFGLESPDYTFDNFPMLGAAPDFDQRAITSINYTKDMPKTSSRIHVGSVLVDELPCLRTVTKGWHTVSITAKDGSMGLGGLVFLDTSYFETIRNRYTKFRNNVEVKPITLTDYRDLTIYRNNKNGDKRSIHFGSNLRSNDVSGSIWVKDEASGDTLNMLSVTPTGTALENNLYIIPNTKTDAKSLMVVRQKLDGTDTLRANYGLFNHMNNTKLGAGVALYDYNDSTKPTMLTSVFVNDEALLIGKYTKDNPQQVDRKGIDIGNNVFRTKDIYSINGIVQVSDRNLKDNIVDTDLGLDFINQLRPVNYTLKNGTSGRVHSGLIAQEVEEILGDNDKAMLIKSTTLDEVTGDEEVTYSLRYTELIAPLIKSIQELSQEVADLKKELNKQNNTSK